MTNNTHTYKRGDILLVNFGETIGSEQGGTRPALIIQNDKGNLYSTILQVAPITSQQKKDMPTHMTLDESCGLKCKSTVLFEQSRAIDKQRVIKFIGHVDLEKTNSDVKINIVFGCLTFLGDAFRKIVSV